MNGTASSPSPGLAAPQTFVPQGVTAMIAKTGIIVSTAVAGLVAVSPLAYAACNHDKHHSSHNDHGHHYVQADYQHHNNHGGWNGHGGNRDNGNGDRSCTQRTAGVSTGNGRGGGLINISNNTIQVPVQACNNNILSNIGLGILGSGRATSR